MVVVGGPGGADESDFVHEVAHMREPVGHFDAILSPLLEPGLQGVERELDLVLSRNKRLEIFLGERVGEDPLVRCFRKLLAGVLRERGFGIERFDVGNAAQHEQPDHAFRFGRKVRLTSGRQPVIFVGARLAGHHGAEG